MGGTAYAMLPDNEEYLAHFAERYQKKPCRGLRPRTRDRSGREECPHPGKLPGPLCAEPQRPRPAALAPLELAAERVGVPEDIPYTPKLLAATFGGQL